MTHQLDMVPLDAASLDRIGASMPKAREMVEPRLPLGAVFPRFISFDDFDRMYVCSHTRGRCTCGCSRVEWERRRATVLADIARADVGHELVLPERAREDHR